MKRCLYSVTVCFSVFLICWVVAPAQNPSPSPTPAAAPPASDIFIIDVASHNGQLKFGAPKKITDVVGYNNQPSFTADGQSILYTSIRDKQADIYRYDLHSGATTQVTKTPESEYSPTLMPDGKSISVVRVEADNTQRLWKFPLADGAPPSLILEKIKPVGYHLWIDDHTLALFILGKPNTLQIVDTRTEKAETITENPGRILRRIPHQNKFSFVHKISDKEWAIKAFDLRTRLPSGMLLMARDSKLFAVVPLNGKTWSEVADFSAPGLKGITRIAVNAKGDQIAIVARH